jgi:histone arginine demethylase JMJD6
MYSSEHLGMIEFIQYPGETVFVPAGMWHAVLNLDDTIAVTQNFMSDLHFEDSWQSVVSERKTLASEML